MTDYKVFRKWLDEILGIPIMAQKALEKEMKYAMMKKPKRARGAKGRYKGDDKSTPNVNEAWENE